MRQSGIYKITNPNGQAYIGQSVNLRQRLQVYMRFSNGSSWST